MKIGYVVKCYPRYSETFVVNEILAHEAAGAQVEIFSLRPPEGGHFQDVISRVRAPVSYLWGKGVKANELWSALWEIAETTPDRWNSLEVAQGEAAHDLYQAVLLAREVRRKGIRHLHAHFANAATSIARLAAHFAGISYTFTAHAKDIFHDSVRPDDLRRKLLDATAAVTVSDYNVRYLRETYGPAAARIQRIYNGLHLERFPYEAPRDRPHRVVAVGRLVEKKGFTDLIEACAVLAARGRPFSCRIIGTGEQEAELRARIGLLGLEGRVEMLGARPQREVVQLIQDASVFAAPCVVGDDGNRDGLPTVLLEAMALGTPCVSTDVTGIPEVLRDDVTGLMVPQHDPAALARAIEQLLEEADLRVRLANRARRLIETEFNVDLNTARLREIFQTAGSVEVKAVRKVS